MLMPYIEGEDLDQLLTRHGKLYQDEALMLTGQLASLLMYAETLGIVHCDLSPGNIRLNRFGLYSLLDSGLSRSSATASPTAISAWPVPLRFPARSPQWVSSFLPFSERCSTDHLPHPSPAAAGSRRTWKQPKRLLDPVTKREWSTAGAIYLFPLLEHLAVLLLFECCQAR